MKDFKVVYLPIGVPTFHLESANIQFNKSIKMMKNIIVDVLFPQEPLLTLESLKIFLDSINPDLIVLQNITFANSAYVAEIIKKFSCPIILWTLREPIIDGGRLRLNSLTGAYSAGNLFYQVGREDFEYVFGAPEEERVKKKIEVIVKVLKMKKTLKNINIATIGNTPQGFGFGRALDSELLRTFGVNLLTVEVRELMMKGKKYLKEDYIQLLDETRKKVCGLEKIPEKNIEDFGRLYKAYKDYIEENNIKALASRCWPDYFVEFGTPICGVLGMLNDELIASACEADLIGALSMYIGMEFTKNPVFFGDPVSLNEDKNTITYWHCGTAACSLARKDKGAEIGVHPNRKIGPTMEFGCKEAEKVTIFRIGRKTNGEFRFFIAKGKALDEPKQFLGTSVVVKPENKSLKIVEDSIKDGWEPHFVVVYGDISEELEILGKFLRVEVCKY